MQIRTILELEASFTMLRCFYKVTEKTLYDTRYWRDWLRGSRKLERRAAHINDLKDREDFSQSGGGEEVSCS